MLFGAVMWRQAHEISLQRDAARFEAQRAEASNEFMSVMLEEVGPPDQPLTPIQLLDKGVELLERQYGDDPRFAARMYVNMSNRFSDIGSVEREARLLARAASLARESGDEELIASVECTVARSEIARGRVEEAKDRMETVRQLMTRLPRPSHTTEVECLRSRADLADIARDTEAALAHLVEARALLEKAEDTRGLKYNSVLTDIGGIYFRTGRFKDAFVLNARTAETLDRNGRGGTMARSVVAGNRATLLYMLGETRRAEEAGREALHRVEEIRQNHAGAPAAAIRYAITLLRLERIDEAAHLLANAREHSEALGNPLWKSLATYHLGAAQLARGNRDQARILIEEAQGGAGRRTLGATAIAWPTPVARSQSWSLPATTCRRLKSISTTRFSSFDIQRRPRLRDMRRH